MVCQTRTWNFHCWGSDAIVETAAVIFHSLPLHLCHASKSAVCQFYITWSTWNSRKALNLVQSYILMWRFWCSSCRSFLNSLFSCRLLTLQQCACLALNVLLSMLFFRLWHYKNFSIQANIHTSVVTRNSLSHGIKRCQLFLV